MKLAIFIPAYNEEHTIEAVIKAIPSHISPFTEQKIFVIDDGSTDTTADTAYRSGAEVIKIQPNRGLATAYKIGLLTCLQWGADIICHLDADGQYNPAEIPLILTPIIEGRADFVTGDRQIEKNAASGIIRKYGNMIGSWFLRLYSGIKVRDASSGFRAYNRAASEKLEVRSSHTYTHETLIQARYKGLRISEIPITFVSRKDDSSRLTRNLFGHIVKSLIEIRRAKKYYSKSR